MRLKPMEQSAFKGSVSSSLAGVGSPTGERWLSGRGTPFLDLSLSLPLLPNGKRMLSLCDRFSSCDLEPEDFLRGDCGRRGGGEMLLWLDKVRSGDVGEEGAS